MAEIGWIKLHRSFLDWEWYQDINVRLLAIHLILKANTTERKWRGITIERGQLITSTEGLASEVGLTRQQTRTALNKLLNSEFCNQQTTNRFSIVTICKYGDYQGSKTCNQPTDNQQITNNQPTDNQQITTTKEYKNLRSKEYKEGSENKFSQSPLNSGSDLNKKTSVEKEKSSAKKEKLSIEQRKKAFERSLIPHVAKYGKEMIREFCDYWSEPNQQMTKLNFEMQRTWSTEGRLRTWHKRQEQFNNERSKANRQPNTRPTDNERREGYATTLNEIVNGADRTDIPIL